MKTNKDYIVTLKNGKVIKAKFDKILDDSIVLNVNGNAVKFPKNEIESVKKKRLSLINLIA